MGRGKKEEGLRGGGTEQRCLREQGEGLFEGLVDTQEELYSPNIPEIFFFSMRLRPSHQKPYHHV